MYCINCGVKLADSEDKCPLCNTAIPIPHPTNEEHKLYPTDKMPIVRSKRNALNGCIIILLLIPSVLTFFSDIHDNGNLDWFGYVMGGIFVFYVLFALPVWFRKPNPVIFIPCDFAAIALYVWYIDYASNGNWYWTFALPVIFNLGIIVCSLITLLRYLKRGRLYVIGGCIIALGVFVLMFELLLAKTFTLPFDGWSIYPLITLVLLGCMFLYLAINKQAREMMARKLFF